MEHIIKIDGMTCGGCAASVERAIKTVAGVASATVVLADKSAKVEFDAAIVDVAAIKAAIEAAGYDVLV